MKTAEKDIAIKKWHHKDWKEVEGITWKDVLSFKELWLYLCILCLVVTIAALTIFLFALNARIEALIEYCRSTGTIYLIIAGL